jgi:hypothetical protein
VQPNGLIMSPDRSFGQASQSTHQLLRRRGAFSARAFCGWSSTPHD